MERFTFIVLCVGAVLLSVNGNVDSEVDRILSKTKEVLVKYQDLDQVPFQGMRSSLVVLDHMAKNYHGNSRGAIYEATNLGYSATTKYFQATDLIFSWCVKSKVLVGFMIDNNPPKKEAGKAIYKMISKGLEAIKESLNKLKEVRDGLSLAGEKLKPVPGNLTLELEALRQEHLTEMQRLEKWSLKRLFELITEVVSMVTVFVSGNVGLALGIKSIMTQLGIPLAVIEGKQAPTNEEKWKMTEAYYKSVIQTFHLAQNNVTIAWEGMNKGISEVTALHASIEDYWEVIEDLPNLNETTVTELKKLKDVFTAFTTSHSGSDKNTRRKREVIQYRGLDVERISDEVDSYLKATVNTREAVFWSAQTLPKIQKLHISDLSKFSFS